MVKSHPSKVIIKKVPEQMCKNCFQTQSRIQTNKSQDARKLVTIALKTAAKITRYGVALTRTKFYGSLENSLCLFALNWCWAAVVTSADSLSICAGRFLDLRPLWCSVGHVVIFSWLLHNENGKPSTERKTGARNENFHCDGTT